jgi:hypothetical protein
VLSLRLRGVRVRTLATSVVRGRLTVLLVSRYIGNLYLSHTNFVSQRVNQKKGLKTADFIKPDKNHGIALVHIFINVFSFLSEAVCERTKVPKLCFKVSCEDKKYRLTLDLSSLISNDV